MSNNEDRNILLSVLAGIGLWSHNRCGIRPALCAKARCRNKREDIKKAAEDLKVKADEVIGELSTSVDELVSKAKISLKPINQGAKRNRKPAKLQ